MLPALSPARSGAEFREEGLRNDVNSDLPDPTRIDIVAQYGDSFGGDVGAHEAFVEFDSPGCGQARCGTVDADNPEKHAARDEANVAVVAAGTSTRT